MSYAPEIYQTYQQKIKFAYVINTILTVFMVSVIIIPILKIVTMIKYHDGNMTTMITTVVIMAVAIKEGKQIDSIMRIKLVLFFFFFLFDSKKFNCLFLT